MVNKKLFFVALFISMLLCGCAELFMPYDGGWAQNDNSMIDYSATTTKRTSQRSDVSKKSEIGSSTATVSKKLTESSQANSDDVELTVSGDGPTKDAATKSALRSAIELAYGAFVSANTHILNDAVVEDEIISSTSGNIRHYEYVSEIERDGKWFVVVKAVVSKGKLISYVKSKGGNVEISGQSFVENMEMERLHRQADQKIIDDCWRQIGRMYDMSDFYDYKIHIYEPQVVTIKGNRCIKIDVNVHCSINQNCREASILWRNTLKAISITKEEAEVSKKYGVYGCDYSINYFQQIEGLNVASTFNIKNDYGHIRPLLKKVILEQYYVMTDGIRVYLLNDWYGFAKIKTYENSFRGNVDKTEYWEHVNKIRKAGFTELGGDKIRVSRNNNSNERYTIHAFSSTEGIYDINGDMTYTLYYTEEEFSRLSEIRVLPYDDIHEKEISQLLKMAKNNK